METLKSACEETVSDSELDRFVSENSKGTIFHTSNWMRVIEKQGYSPLHFVARDNAGAVKAFFPFFLIAIPKTSTKIAHSMPQSEMGGPLAAEGVRADEWSGSLLKAMRKQAVIKRILMYTVVTPEVDFSTELLPNSKIESPAWYLQVDLKRTPPAEIWDNVFTRDGRQRNNIRRVEKDGVTIRAACEADLPEFYSLYSETLRRAGAPPYPYSFLHDIWTFMWPKNFNILLSIQNEKILGGSAFLCFPERRRIWMIMGAYRTDVGTRNAINLYTWWHTFLWAHENGYSRIDLGTGHPNPGDPIFRFKKQFAPVTSRKYIVREPMISYPSILVLRRIRDIIEKI